MEIEKWNSKQKELFELFFDNSKNEDCVEISQLMNMIKPFNIKWQELYNILKENSDGFDKYSTIRKIKKVFYNDIEYLIMQINIWSYICIDLKNKELVDFKEDLLPFSEKFFIDNFDEREIPNPNMFYHTLSLNKEGLEILLQYINDNSSLFIETNDFKYTKGLTDGFVTSLMFEIDTGKITIYFGNNQGIVNYIFINSNLIPVGISNPTGNKEDLKNMANRLKEISIPVSVIPNYLFNEANNKKYQKKI